MCVAHQQREGGSTPTSALHKPKLLIALASTTAARFACTHFHYARKYPAPYPMAHHKFGVWEDGEFIGAVLYNRGANLNMHRFIGVEKHECLELVRVALRSHRTPVTRILAITFRLLRKSSPEVRVLFSYADPNQGHEGTIYTAGGWTYAGASVTSAQLITSDLQVIHHRNMGVAPYAAVRKMKPKHRFLYPLRRDAVELVRSLREEKRDG